MEQIKDQNQIVVDVLCACLRKYIEEEKNENLDPLYSRGRITAFQLILNILKEYETKSLKQRLKGD